MGISYYEFKMNVTVVVDTELNKRPKMGDRMIEEDNIKELIVFSVLVCLIRDKGCRRDSVSVLKLHECWHLIKETKIEGVNVNWFRKNPVTRIWEELDRAIQRLVFSHWIERGKIYRSSTLSLLTGTTTERKVFTEYWRIYSAILQIFPDFARLYDAIEEPVVIDGIREMPIHGLENQVSTPEA